MVIGPEDDLKTHSLYGSTVRAFPSASRTNLSTFKDMPNNTIDDDLDCTLVDLLLSEEEEDDLEGTFQQRTRTDSWNSVDAHITFGAQKTTKNQIEDGKRFLVPKIHVTFPH